ncbi:hypothetical protein PVAND_007477 [Polypedilum vanderplanki]|uniref:Small ribosomal subunit protein mS40 n=1 Tax=Polypedilum vanderplanki TaxID=319348 RepID=A0A9J6C6T3_POLVA|nr:hypothetical protein PVAND_007477 [Polypedilum vanderplanki]
MMNFLTKIACSSNLFKLNNLSPYSSALVKSIVTTNVYYCEAHENQEAEKEQIKEKIDPSIDRTKIIPVETSIRYLKSAAYKETYGDQAVWIPYRRNHKGLIPPRKTRKTCIRKGKIATGSPCPICRDEYLVLHHENTDLLKQFISPQTGQVLSFSKTGLCQKKHLQLLLAVERAKDHGRIVYDVPQRDYSEYYEQYANKSS